MPLFPRILAIDYGTKRVGLAVSRGSLAEPLLILENNETLFAQLQAVLADEEIEQIVVGLSENEMAQKSKEFAQKLADVTTLPIVFADETLSSFNVHEKIATDQVSRGSGARRAPIDHLAAAEFLQEYLDIHQA